MKFSRKKVVPLTNQQRIIVSYIHLMMVGRGREGFVMTVQVKRAVTVTF